MLVYTCLGHFLETDSEANNEGKRIVRKTDKQLIISLKLLKITIPEISNINYSAFGYTQQNTAIEMIIVFHLAKSSGVGCSRFAQHLL